MISQAYQRSQLDSGLTVISEHLASVRSVSLGVWIKAGTRFEDPARNGVAHFLEHMMFKGTAQRSARDIVAGIERMGGNINAFTSKEQTCYHVETLDEYLPEALAILADILVRDQFNGVEFEKEREVILDEILAVEDTPEELIQDVFAEKLFVDHTLGLPILGTVETLQQIQPGDLLRYYRRYYTAENIIIAAAGNVDHKQLVDLAQQHFSFLPGNGPAAEAETPPVPESGRHTTPRPISQAHLCIGVPGISYHDPQRYELLVLNTILGGGMSSRLFQKIREEQGIAYGIYSFLDFFADTGIFGIYLATDKRKLNVALELVKVELRKIFRKPVPEAELQDACSQLKGNIVLGLESSTARMNWLAIREIYGARFQSIDDTIAAIDRVTVSSLKALTGALFSGERFLEVMLVPKAS